MVIKYINITVRPLMQRWYGGVDESTDSDRST
jgi:hypothetical protein